MGYGARVPHVVRLCDGMEVLIAAYSENGIRYVTLSDKPNLPNLNKLEVLLVALPVSWITGGLPRLTTTPQLAFPLTPCLNVC